MKDFCTHTHVKRFKAAGFTEAQAEALVYCIADACGIVFINGYKEPEKEITPLKENIIKPDLRLNYKPNELLNREEAAEYLGVKEDTLAVWATTKRYALPFIKVGRLVKYKFSDLEKFIDGRKQNGE